MVNSRIFSGKNDARGSIALGDDFFGGGQTDEAIDKEIKFLELLNSANKQKKTAEKVGRRQEGKRPPSDFIITLFFGVCPFRV